MSDSNEREAANGDVGKKTGSQGSLFAFGLPIGIAIGAAIGAATGNIGMWVGIGVALGIGIGGLGTAVGANRDKS